ncbi:MAG: NAD(P)H-dependent oxidoreductase subunit E [bacterium]
MRNDGFQQILAGREGKPHLLIEVLQDLQEAHGYISKEAMGILAEKMEVPLIEIYRVANFYKAFSLVPRGEHVVTVCSGTACHVRSSPLLLAEAVSQLGIEPGKTTEDGLFTLECVNCLGACAIGPVVVFDGVYHPQMTPGKLRRLIAAARKMRKEVAHA